VQQASTEEPFLPFPTSRERVRDATSFRSTWLSSSLNAIRDKGLYERYLETLPREHHDAVTQNVAGVWLPIDVALAHYHACDSLALSRRDTLDIGAQVTRRVHGTSLALAIRLAKQAGVTPWSILAQLQRLWDRTWQGGGICVHQRGPKEAVVEVIKWRCAGIPYVRASMPAVVLGVSEMFCQKGYVSDVPSMASSSSLGIKLQWA
jgi:hypothetical protein